jgi:hypothetical protein
MEREREYHQLRVSERVQAKQSDPFHTEEFNPPYQDQQKKRRNAWMKLYE